MSETVSIRRKPLDDLVEAVKRYLRQAGDQSGQGELLAALDKVVRDVGSADLRAELEKPLPSRVPVEEEGP